MARFAFSPRPAQLRASGAIGRFCDNDGGNITIYSVYIVLLTLTIMGASVDLMRQEASRARLQTTLDRAVLAAADLDQFQTPSDVVSDYVAKAGLDSYVTGVDVTLGLNERTVSADAASSLSTIFLRMSGRDMLPANALATAEERIANVEISLVLDVSGSMRYDERMDNLKPAAKAFVEKVMSGGTESVTTLNLIPFAGQVNPGDIMFDYFLGKRPKIKGNNGWGNGDQDAPGGSLCNNNAENYDEGLADPSCADGADGPVAGGFFSAWPQAISNVVVYFDTDGDDIYDVAHKIEDFPEDAPRDADDFFKGAVAYLMAQDSDLTDPAQFLGISIKGGKEKNRYFQVKGNLNGATSDLGPTKNKGKIPGNTYSYSQIDYLLWEAAYAGPEAEETGPAVNVNMPGSCVEIDGFEFANSSLPLSDEYVPIFHHWAIDPSVMDWGWCPGEQMAIQYYSDNAASLTQFIDDIRMHDGTGAQFGMKYALALLDPTTRDAVSHLIDAGLIESRFEGRPIDWHDPETEKYIVMMTDGQVTDQFRPNDPDAPINGEVELLDQGASSYNVRTARAANLDHLYQQCELARTRGVTVFTIAFETTVQAAEEMRLCASSDSHFFHVHGGEIVDAFDSIARQINNLRLIQ
ncbi:putative Flp pilus-assembly TadE/G-like protein [Antarctobacter heliothermus]|uniref:Putative Flp pilus-assembly TadE/G-like protein n=1 Tax=Antarctobacter heliothermus TaxID=74033 RepID=A0A222E4J9_9RHOB|nr:Tad domain-containing protein [Antarctobacter heliothermus]ASP20881.1 putative Flp pilus-assembly TadE/G-like protein [Antarctobacter heliothermus]